MARNKKTDYQRVFSYPEALRELAKKQRRIEELEWEVNNEWTFNLQQFLDCMAISLHNICGFGPERNRRVMEATKQTLIKYMQMSLREVRETEQGKDCCDFWETQGKMDREVRAALGPNVPDWPERYSEEALFELLKDLRRCR